MISQTKNLKFTVMLLLLCTGLFFPSCTCDEDCATFDNFKMCDTAPSKEGCSSNVNTFAQDAQYLTISVDISKGEPDDRLTATYFLKDGNSFTEFFTQTIALKDIDEEVNGSERKIRASTGVTLKAGKVWPVGDYKVEIELTQENIPLNETRNFSVQ